MEAGATFREPGISKGLIVMVAVSLTLGLGVATGVPATNLNSPSTAPQTQISQGLGGPAQANPAHRGGTQVASADSAPSAGASAGSVSPHAYI